MKTATTRFYHIIFLAGLLCFCLAYTSTSAQNSSIPDSGKIKIRIPFINHPGSLPYFLKLRKAGTRYQTRHKPRKASGPPIKKVIGWHPYWFNTSYFNYEYDVLTHVIYFGADITVNNGVHVNFNGWDTTGLVNYVRTKNKTCKVFLNLYCSGQDMSNFLKNPSYYNSAINILVNSVTAHEADGICLDFEGGPSGLGSYFTNFVSELKQACDEVGIQLCIALPAINSYNLCETDKLTPLINFYIIMGYDYFGSFSSITGPVAPLISKDWINLSVDKSVTTYKNQQVPDSMLCLGVPYFGAIWQTQNLSIPSSIDKFIGYRPFSYAAENNTTFTNDTSIKASYTAYSTKDDSITNRQFWMETYYSLNAKYDYALQNNLAGVGIWALGYDEGTDTLWQLLRDKFTPPVRDTANTLPRQNSFFSLNDPNGIIAILRKHRHAFGFILFILFFALFMALVHTLNTSGAIQKLKDQKLLVPVLIASIALLYGLCIGLFYICVPSYYLKGGIIAASVITLLGGLYAWNKKRKADMP